MILKSLSLQNFKKFKDIKLEFDPDINIIVGPNESGKSSISQAVAELFYADPATRSKTFHDNVGAWSGDQNMVISGEFEAKAANYRLIKDFANKNVELQNLDTGKKSQNLKAIDKVIADLMGLPSRSVFEATAYIGQSEIARIETSDDFVSAIQNAATSSKKVNIQASIRELDKQLKAIRVGVDRPAKNPGPLKSILDQIEHLTNDLNQKRGSWEKVKTASETMKDSGGKLEKISEQIELLEKLLENHKKNDEMSKKLEEVDSRIEEIEGRLNNVKELRIKRQQIVEQLKKYEFFKDLDIDNVIIEISKIEEGEKFVKQEMQRLQLMENTQSVQEEKRMNLMWYSLPIMLLVLSVVVAAILENVAFFGLGLGLSVVIGVLVFLQSNKKIVVEAPNEASKMEELSKRFNQYVAQKQALLSKLQVPSIEEFYKVKASYRAEYERYKEIDSQLKGALGDKSIEQLETEQIKILKQKKEIEVNELTEDVRNAKLNPDDYLKKRRELDMLKLEKRRLEEKSMESQVRTREADVSIDEINSLEERLEELKNRQQYLERKQEVIQLTIDGLNEAITGTAKTANKLVSEGIELFLPSITSGKYSQARLTKDLRIEVFSESKNDWLDPVGVLSRGAVDQIFFLARIAFLKTLVKDSKIPLIIDDAFVTFDANRRQATGEILQKLSEQFQIILFTHSDEYLEWGRVIDLTS